MISLSQELLKDHWLDCFMKHRMDHRMALRKSILLLNYLELTSHLLEKPGRCDLMDLSFDLSCVDFLNQFIFCYLYHSLAQAPSNLFPSHFFDLMVLQESPTFSDYFEVDVVIYFVVLTLNDSREPSLRGRGFFFWIPVSPPFCLGKLQHYLSHSC